VLRKLFDLLVAAPPARELDRPPGSEQVSRNCTDNALLAVASHYAPFSPLGRKPTANAAFEILLFLHARMCLCASSQERSIDIHWYQEH